MECALDNNNMNLVKRARGCAIGHMVADALGAGVEGMSPSKIRALAQATWSQDFVQDHILAVPMGTFTSAGQPGTYRPANGVNDSSFVKTGPPSNENVAKQCARKGCYTDDTNACLALGSSIVECGKVVPEHAAQSYANFFTNNELYRGCPPSAKSVMQAVLNGTCIQETGLPPHFPFPRGSFANGGAMRISLLSVAYRNADAPQMRQAVTGAILSSHRHPEAVDFAVVQASAVQYALHATVEDFNIEQLMAELRSRCETDDMKQVIGAITAALDNSPADEFEIVNQVVSQVKRPGSGMGFQIASVHMAPCVLWAACRHYRDPRVAVQTAIALGGDTDTTAAMVGAIMGALHGEDWCADWAAGLENGPHGRDFALNLAEQLAQLDVTE